MIIVESNVVQSNNSGQYTQVKVSVAPDIASAFKVACAAANVSMASAMSKFMSEFSKTAMQKKPLPDYSTKSQRRVAIKKIINQLEQIMDCEEAYKENIPENLCGSVVFENAEEFISLLDEAIDTLSSI